MREKRKFVRLHAPIGLVYKTLRKHKRTKTHRTLLKDIGGGGASFVPQEELRCGELLQMEIQIPNLAGPVDAVGEVVWFSYGRQGREPMEAAVRFRDIAAKDLHRILEYVYVVGIG